MSERLVSEERLRAVAGYLADQVRQPDFRLLRARRRQRTQRLAAIASAGIVAVLLLGFGLAVRITPGGWDPLRRPAGTHRSAPAGPTVTRLSGVVNGGGGALYAVLSERPLDTPDRVVEWQLVRSTDLGVRWTVQAALPWLSATSRPVLYGGRGDNVWLYDTANESMALFTDRGLSARLWAPGVLGAFTGPAGYPLPSISPDGAALWASAGDAVVLLDGGQDGARAVHKSWSGGTDWLTVLDGGRALARSSDTGIWYLTGDGGGTWEVAADPCAGSTVLDLVSIPGGAWAQCADRAGVALSVSTDGRYWAPRGGPPGTPALLPATAQVAWLAGAGGGVWRSPGDSTWQDVDWDTGGSLGAAGQRQACVAVDASRAACFTLLTGTGPTAAVDRVHATVDAGASWTDNAWTS